MIAKFCDFLERKGERYLGTKAVEVVRRAKVILMLAVGLSYSEIGKRPLAPIFHNAVTG